MSLAEIYVAEMRRTSLSCSYESIDPLASRARCVDRSRQHAADFAPLGWTAPTIVVGCCYLCQRFRRAELRTDHDKYLHPATVAFRALAVSRGTRGVAALYVEVYIDFKYLQCVLCI